jgi:UDP-N-acetylglucosamine 2-epimerase (non-hydrolysing)
MEIKVMIVVGARPNFIKAAPIIAAIKEYNESLIRCSSNESSESGPITIRSVLVHTDQHFDQIMSDLFFKDLKLSKPDVHLGVGSGSHAVQTAEIMKRFEGVLLRECPDVVVVVGDVNSTLACALVAAKISYDSNKARPLIAHVEAGLRSFERSMPEEVNRILTDHVSDLLFVTEDSGLQNLRHEGIADERIHFVGNTMIDSLLAFKDKAEVSVILNQLDLRSDRCENGSVHNTKRYALLTLHRPSNVDHRETFMNILEGLEELSDYCPIIFPAHPRTQKRIVEFGLEHFFGLQNVGQGRSRSNPTCAANRIHLVHPLGYLDFLCLMKHAALVVTDSGGIQEETTCLGIPCVTVRENTERPVTLNNGTNILAGVRVEGIREAIRRQQLAKKPCNLVPRMWDGKAGLRIVEILLREFCNTEISHRRAVPDYSKTLG